MSNSEVPAEPVVVELALRWGDMDALGHVNNVQIARLFEEARVRAMRVWFGEASPDGILMLLARQEIEFTSMLHYSPEPVRGEVWVSRIGGRSCDFASRLLDPHGGVAALCETTLVVVDAVSGGSRDIPEGLRRVLETQRREPVAFRRR
ncbi:MAG: acyl-CoA thioesterase [Gordonia sp. (in: high G+C Gram-positive bacteria)]|uniref:acyl-CoA thioesterase n=1 Tax=Gordonia sp. (in: high G+C Gram-positive bacteria) TaxID=84139 RepID=UPI003BB76D87